MAKKKTENIKAAPVLRAQGGDQPTAAVTKSYSMRDDWKDKGKVNYVAFKSVDGEVQDLTVNGEPAGGGGSDFSIAQVAFRNNTEDDITLGVSIPVIDTENDVLYDHNYIAAGTSTLSIVVYKDKPTIFSFATSATVTVTGSITKRNIGQNQKEIRVTGDGTLTVA